MFGADNYVFYTHRTRRAHFRVCVFAEFDNSDETARYRRTRNVAESVRKYYRSFAVDSDAVHARVLQHPCKSADNRPCVFAVSYARYVVKRPVITNGTPRLHRGRTQTENSADVEVCISRLRAYGNGRFDVVEHYILACRTRNAACVDVVGTVYSPRTFSRVYADKSLHFHVSDKTRTNAVAVCVSEKSVIGVMRASHERKLAVNVTRSD